MTVYGGSCRNTSTATYEAKHQAPKRTLVNRKEAHLQQVRKQNVVQTLQFVASGEQWQALELDTSGKFVVRERTVEGGEDLRRLVLDHYPELNPFTTTTATARDQGSTISVRDEDIFLSVEITSFICKNLAKSTSRGTAKVVDFAATPGTGQVVWENNTTIFLPTAARVRSCLPHFPGTFPGSEWFRDPSKNLRAYRQVDVYCKPDHPKVKPPYLFSIFGWGSKGGRRSRVLVQLNNR